MRHRCPASLTLVAAAFALFIGVRPGVARANSVNSTGLAVPVASSQSDFEVIFDVSASGGVVPPPGVGGAGTGTPLTVLSGSSSSLLSTGALFVGLRNTVQASGQSSQQLGLAFAGSGFATTGILKFTLDVNGSLPTPPQLTFDTASPYGASAGLEIINPTTYTTNTSSGATATYILEGVPTFEPAVGTVNNPEPLSLWLWLMISVAALFNVRRMRRKQQQGALAIA